MKFKSKSLFFLTSFFIIGFFIVPKISSASLPWTQYAGNPVLSQTTNSGFSSVVKDAREWKKLGDLESQIKLGHKNQIFYLGLQPAPIKTQGLNIARTLNGHDGRWKKFLKIIDLDKALTSSNFTRLQKGFKKSPIN